MEASSRRHKPVAHLIAEATNILSVVEVAMYTRIAVEEDAAALLEEIIRRGCDRCVLQRQLHRAVKDDNIRLIREDCM
jgi:hypothetical protein